MPLVSSKEMFKKAYEGSYAIGAFDVNNMEMLQGIMAAAKDEKSPLILQTSKSVCNYTNVRYIKKMIEIAVEESGLPVCLHLNHGESFEKCKDAIEIGFNSVMIDASCHSFNENIEITKRVVDYAHDRNVVVEAQLGNLIGVNYDNVNKDYYTDPAEAEEFVTKTGIDSLGIAIGTSDGAFKFKGEPKLMFDVLTEIEKRLPSFPLVLHGASSVPFEYVDVIAQYGGVVMGAKGVPEAMLRRAARMAVCKINIDIDLELAFSSAVRKHLFENPAHFDPRQFLAPAREAVKKCVSYKLVNVLGCNGKA